MTTQAVPRAPFRLALWLLPAATVALALGAAWPRLARRFEPPPSPPLPVLAQVPPFELTAQSGRAFGDKDLAGKVWVGNFIFTRCPNICPLFTRNMQLLQKRSAATTSLELVSFSVDPDHDTPERLSAYAAGHRVDLTNWTFLTGPRAELERIITQGMKVHMQRGSNPDDLASIVHGSHFVLVDKKLRVRGYYKFDEPEALAAVLRDAQGLADE